MAFRGETGAKMDHVKPSQIHILCIPTTLSGAEFTEGGGGATNDKTLQKHLYHDSTGPKAIILDPELSLSAPVRVWLSTGVRSIDHCVEALCSLEAAPESDLYATRGLHLLLQGLLKTKREPQELSARLSCMLGVAEATKVVALMKPLGVTLGASHGIGHQLGPLGVPHGETSCVLLPAVMKYNAKVNKAQQERVLEILWDEPLVQEVLIADGLVKGKFDLGDALAAVIKHLDLPGNLSEVNINRDKFQDIARTSLTDFMCQTNPVRLTEESQVLQILELASQK
jgi:alcohol dehydrogenase class IV